MEDDDSRMHVRNLSIHCTASEEEALNLVCDDKFQYYVLNTVTTFYAEVHDPRII